MWKGAYVRHTSQNPYIIKMLLVINAMITSLYIRGIERVEYNVLKHWNRIASSILPKLHYFCYSRYIWIHWNVLQLLKWLFSLLHNSDLYSVSWRIWALVHRNQVDQERINSVDSFQTSKRRLSTVSDNSLMYVNNMIALPITESCCRVCRTAISKHHAVIKLKIIRNSNISSFCYRWTTATAPHRPIF